MTVEYLGYQIKPDKEYPSTYRIALAGKGGKVPDRMLGLFTSIGLCKQEIDLYLYSGKKGISNDKASDTSGS